MRTTLLSTILVCLCLAGYSQKIRLTDTRNHWTDFAFDADGHTWHPTYGYVHRSDSMIAGMAYKLMANGYNGYLVRKDTTLVREDTTAGIVYIQYHDTDRILYNYNLQLGDTISYAWHVEQPRIDTVVSTDSTLIDGVYHKILTMHGSGIGGSDTAQKYSYTVFEGIGSPGGPLQPLLVYNFEGGEYVQCFEQDTTKPSISATYHGTFNNSYSFTNCGPTSVSTVSAPGKITVAPNPGNKYSKIILSQTMSGTLTIVNAMGQVVMSKAFENSTTLPVGELLQMPGMYFYYVTDRESGKVVSGNFVFEE